jgi:hypothetical protein
MVGTAISHYRITERPGEGGSFGVVLHREVPTSFNSRSRLASNANHRRLCIAWMAGLLALLLGACGSGSSGDFDATDFGAIADGATDSTQAIQSAIDEASAAGGRVLVPPAEAPYLISKTLLIRGSGVEIVGAGATIRFSDDAAGEGDPTVILASGSEDNPIHDVAIRGLTVDANFYAQEGAERPRGIEFRFVAGARVTDVTIRRPFVGLEFGRGCVDAEARDVVITDFAEDGFDASGDANHFSGAKTRDIRFIDVVASDAPRADGNAFEIEDGVENVLVENATVENVAGNGFGLRNHFVEGKEDHSRNVELRNVTVRGTGGRFAIYGRCAPREEFPDNSYHEMKLTNVETDGAVAFIGPIEDLEITGGSFAAIYLGFEGPDDVPAKQNAVATAKLQNLQAEQLRINGMDGTITLSNLTLPKGQESVSIEGSGADVQTDW